MKGVNMALPQGINFRDTLAFVTDVSPDTYDNYLVTGVYPWTTPEGNSVGYDPNGDDVQLRNRVDTNNAKIAGCHLFVAPITGASRDYRIDLPSAGNYNVRIAAGEGFYGREVDVSLYDTTTLLGSLSSGTTSAGQRFKDATNTEYTNVTWPGSNTAVQFTFATTICRFSLLDVTGVEAWAHLYIESAGGAAPAKRLTLMDVGT